MILYTTFYYIADSSLLKWSKVSHLVSGNKVGIVYPRTGHEGDHLLSELLLQLVVQDLGPHHGLCHVQGADVPAINHCNNNDTQIVILLQFLKNVCLEKKKVENAYGRNSQPQLPKLNLRLLMALLSDINYHQEKLPLQAAARNKSMEMHSVQQMYQSHKFFQYSPRSVILYLWPKFYCNIQINNYNKDIGLKSVTAHDFKLSRVVRLKNMT